MTPNPPDPMVALRPRARMRRLALRALDMPNLSGTWQLNKDASDDPQKVMEEARARRPDGGGSGGGGGHGGGGMATAAAGTGEHGRRAAGRPSRHGLGAARPPAGPDPEMLAALETLKILTRSRAHDHRRRGARARRLHRRAQDEEERSHGGKTKVEAQLEGRPHRDRLEARDRREDRPRRSRSRPTVRS